MNQDIDWISFLAGFCVCLILISLYTIGKPIWDKDYYTKLKK